MLAAFANYKEFAGIHIKWQVFLTEPFDLGIIKINAGLIFFHKGYCVTVGSGGEMSREIPTLLNSSNSTQIEHFTFTGETTRESKGNF